MADSYVVTGPAAYVYRTDGSATLLYAGAPVPDDATPECISHLLDEGSGGAAALIAKTPASFEPGGMANDVPGVPVVPASKTQAKVDGKSA
jgi:hypothetical protein